MSTTTYVVSVKERVLEDISQRLFCDWFKRCGELDRKLSYESQVELANMILKDVSFQIFPSSLDLKVRAFFAMFLFPFSLFLIRNGRVSLSVPAECTNQQLHEHATRARLKQLSRCINEYLKTVLGQNRLIVSD